VRRQLPFTLLAGAVLALAAVPLGTSVFVLGFALGDSPCVLCWSQRTGMAILALLGLFVLRYGPRPRYLGMAVLVSTFGLYMAVRHSAAHVVRDIGQGFAVEILGAHTYTWSAFVYFVALVTFVVLLLLLRDGEATAGRRPLTRLDGAAFLVFLVVVAGNLVQAFTTTGPPPYMGQSDPVRFSWSPGAWVWSLEQWRPVPVSVRGRWAIPKPRTDQLAAEPGAGPLVSLPALEARARLRVPGGLEGPFTGLAYDERTDRLAVATADGIALADAGLERLVNRVTIDTTFSIDFGRLAAVAFLDERTLAAVSENKSFVVVRENASADAAANYRFFTDGADRFDEVRRGRFTTVRAKMAYVLSLAHDAARASLLTVSVPNPTTRAMVVSRFALADFTLSAEFVPEPAAPLSLAAGRSLGEYYVTGATVADGHLYAVSAAYSTLLVIDLTGQRLTAAHALPVAGRPAGIAARGDELYVLSEEGEVVVVPRPAPAGPRD
jgi:disulfide bond formation protein DsbB